jgi:hypothetical protein
MPNPIAETVPEALPRHVSKPAAARPGATIEGAVLTVVVPDDTIRLVVAPLTVELTFEVVVPLRFELTVAVVLAGLLTVREDCELPFPRLVDTARAPDWDSLLATPVPTPTAV